MTFPECVDRVRNVCSIEAEDELPSDKSTDFIGCLNTTTGSDSHNEAFVSIDLPDFDHNVKFKPGRVLQYFKFSDPVYLEIDASKHGLGAVLFQDSGPIEYASCAQTPTEQNYSQIEKEMLAVLFGCIRFHRYDLHDYLQYFSIIYH